MSYFFIAEQWRVIIIEAHIIPQVLLRGFRVDLLEDEKDNYDKKNAKINIFYKEKNEFSKDVLIRETSTKTDFYGEEIESFLQNKFETPFGNLKTKLMDLKNPRYTRVSPDDFELLLTFSANIWRRSDTHLESKYRNRILSDNDLKKILYSKESLDINRNSPIFLKTVYCYDTYIIFNDTTIKFPIHNKHATIRNYERIPSFPDYIFEPISNKFMIIHKRRNDYFEKNKKVFKQLVPSFMRDETIKVKTRIVSDNDIIVNIIRTYCLVESRVDYYVCDDSNYKYIMELYDDLEVHNKAIVKFKDIIAKHLFDN